jgi:outer membrane protein assembly factor BamD
MPAKKLISISPSRFLWTSALLVLLAVFASGCSSNKYERDKAAAAATLYERGGKSLQSGNYRFPFSDLSKQAQLDLMYVYYKSDAPESAIDAADNFIRENPTHPRVDYAYYIKGLVYFPNERGILERLFRIDDNKRPPKGLDDSYLAFATLIERFPGSDYAEDSRERMIFLRNRLAQHQIYIAEWYVRRGAFVAAANRARRVLEEYNGSTSAYQAMEMLALCYEKLGLKDLESDTRELMAANQHLKEKRKRLLP